jgi:hypothetical protein
MNNILKSQPIYQNQINTYCITRLVKNSKLTDDLWNTVKADVLSYITKKYNSKETDMIISNNNIIKALKSNHLNLNVEFYTALISQDSSSDNILFIADKNKPQDSIHTSIYDINQDFYNIIKINNSILDLSVAA